ncbi:glycosyltransferase family A protein [Marinobacter salexigens]|uniref:glycosyltransferase family A protein n=1 Tax=Marinobacter salexigens TaxID=1925763 RepID=UPI000C28EFE9|nr:glycosyltransferase family A protein [Marinobacter salexigens]
MELGIVMPLKAKAVAKDWSVTSENLKATVDSVLAQNSDAFHAVVVGHDCPAFFAEQSYQDSKCEFLPYSDFEPPKAGPDEPENQLKYEFDRCTKILRGIMHLKQKYPSITHWFSLDADDLVRNNFVEVLKKHEQFDAIILEKGYFYFKNTGIFHEENEFSAYCGSSSIISDRVFDLPSQVNEKSYRDTPFGNISHVHMRKRLHEGGWSISIPEERVIMYVRDNGENISNDAFRKTYYNQFKKLAKLILRYKFVGKDVKKSFGLT